MTAEDYSNTNTKKLWFFNKRYCIVWWRRCIKPEFGVVFLSLLFNDSIENDTTTGPTTKQETKDSIVSLLKDLSVASFDVKFSDPVKTFIETTTFFQFNPNLTSLSENAVKTDVTNVISTYFTNNTGKFKQSFRRSNLLSLIDAVSPSVLSSRMEVKMKQRFTPTLTAIQDHSLRFPVNIADADDVNRIVTSN